MKNLLTFFFCTVLGSIMAETLNVQGYVGGKVYITCSHAFAKYNIKFFCTGSCKGEDILIKSDWTHNPTVRGRFSLLDEGTGTFIVTFSDLKMSDSGKYWCGVERVLVDTYQTVMLTVSEAPAPTMQPATMTLDPSPTTEEMTTEIPSAQTSSATIATTATAPVNREMFLISVGAGLASLLVIFIILLLILVKLKRKHRNNATRNSQADANPHITAKPASSNQQLITKTDPSSAISSNSPSSPPDPHDSLHYATVSVTGSSQDVNSERANGYHANHLQPTAAASESLYCNVQATPTAPSAEDPNAVIYATVKKVKKKSAV